MQGQCGNQLNFMSNLDEAGVLLADKKSSQQIQQGRENNLEIGTNLSH